jgi:hypothetical protein
VPRCDTILSEGDSKSLLKRKEEKTMMVNFCISNEWFEEIKELIHYENPEYITTGYCSGHVEVDVEEEEFRRVSRALGWML